jgi:hypothetical protein
MSVSWVDSAYITATNESGENRHRPAAVTEPAWERIREGAPGVISITPHLAVAR